ncbi:radical SAM superfamily protein [Methanobrevibacter cuticularis]|uniref:Radical SAM superfamily protein n=1 Tax=Methanobrevibacter cuticularis TaxID=47311 RepID=A0A166EQG2_9EURY|nr:radical SAM protein [Methanobrevibacter cuticularis]KZX16899.1 radical SAM superfamily protein [Methanobrevibacter cuticularis]
MGNIEKIAKKYSFEVKSVKSILNQRKGKRSFFLEDYTLNPYMGCSFNCVYCYINGSKYANHTNSYVVKENAYELLYTQLKNKVRKEQRGILNLGSASDPYMDIEEELFLTRDILNLAARFKFPVHIITKSDLILRDIDILKKIQENAILPNDLEDDPNLKIIISFSFSTVSDKIANIFEASAPRPSKRLKAIKTLKSEGFLVGAVLMPILPYLTDTEEALEATFSKFKKMGVDYVIYGGLTLFGNNNRDSRVRYYNMIENYYPDILKKTKRLFGKREAPTNSYHKKTYKKVEKIAKKYDIPTSIRKT